ncbi:MAG: hypothetical protein JKY52_09640 [Flavobacteriales bacterium]|nr:hypothetical protein [Flavobacteriales bacterium]
MSDLPLFETVADKRIADLEQQLEEVKASNARLRVHSEAAVERMRDNDIPYADVLDRVLKQTPKQSLVEHDTAIIRQAYIDGANYGNDATVEGCFNIEEMVDVIMAIYSATHNKTEE